MEPIPYEDGVKVNDYEDKPTWLVVADSAYNIIGEIPVERDLQPVNMYFTKDHVIIEKYHEDGIKTDKPVFAVYEWQRVD